MRERVTIRSLTGSHRAATSRHSRRILLPSAVPSIRRRFFGNDCRAFRTAARNSSLPAGNSRISASILPMAAANSGTPAAFSSPPAPVFSALAANSGRLAADFSAFARNLAGLAANFFTLSAIPNLLPQRCLHKSPQKNARNAEKPALSGLCSLRSFAAAPLILQLKTKNS